MLIQIILGVIVLFFVLFCSACVYLYFTGNAEPKKENIRGRIIRAVAIFTIGTIFLTISLASAIVTGAVILKQIGY